jgi:hypothetical protein
LEFLFTNLKNQRRIVKILPAEAEISKAEVLPNSRINSFDALHFTFEAKLPI